MTDRDRQVDKLLGLIQDCDTDGTLFPSDCYHLAVKLVNAGIGDAERFEIGAVYPRIPNQVIEIKPKDYTKEKE